MNCYQVDNFANQNVISPSGGLEPPTFRLTAERASRLRHGGLVINYLTHIFHNFQLILRLNKR